MKIRWPWQKKHATLNESALENLLAATLQPVEPRADFVKDLRTQLVGPEERSFLGLPRRSLQNGVLVAGAAFSVLLLLATSVRVVVSVLGAVGLLHQFNRGMKEQAAPSPKVAI